MKTIVNLKLILIACCAMLIMTLPMGCSPESDNNVTPLYNALVTVKKAHDGACYLQLDDSTTVFPTNIKTHPFGGKQVRALCKLDEVKEEVKGYDRAAKVLRLDSILTKKVVKSKGESEDLKLGHDPIDILDDWKTVSEDNYLTLFFSTIWHPHGKPHIVNLVYGTNPKDPYEVTFRHDARGEHNGYWGAGLVAFDLSALPETKGKVVDLTLKWESFNGPKTVKFKYCTGKRTPMRNTIIPDRTYMREIR